MQSKDRIIVALDVDNTEKAIGLVEQLAAHVGSFKIGLEFITTMLASVICPVDVGEADKNVAKIRHLFNLLGGKVFWDGKFDDIPNSVGAASKVVSGMGVQMFNVHSSSGIDSVMAAVEARGAAHVLAVSVLTSFEENDGHLNFNAPTKVKVLQFAREAKLAGCTGLISSPQELGLLGKRKELRGLKKITPGIRASDSPPDDQNRTLPPREAIRAGADWLVIGRPITTASSPVDAAKAIATEISVGLTERLHRELFELQKIKFGAFKLKLHQKNPDAPLSPIYLDIRGLPDYVYELAGDILHDLVVADGVEFDYVIGIPKAGEPIGKALAKAVGKPHLRIEKVEGEDGRHIGSNILDPFEKGRKILLVDDLVTKAQTKYEAIASIEANSLEVAETLVLYDREQGGLKELNQNGKRTVAAASLSKALQFFVSQKQITSQKAGEVLDYIAAN